MKLNNQNLQQRLADDYVMGLMSSRARSNFEKRMRADSSLREEVKKSESLWNLLSLSVSEKTPPRKVWMNISARLFQEKPTSISQLRQNLRNTPTITPNKSTWLKTWAIAASISTLSLATYIGLDMLPFEFNKTQQMTAKENALHMAVLINDQQQAGWLMKYDQQSQRIHVQTLQARLLDKQHTYELWIIADGVEQPQSLGLMPEIGEYNLALNETQMALLAKVKKFAVSIEPAGGSPTGQPTTVPVYLGDVSKI